MKEELGKELYLKIKKEIPYYLESVKSKEHITNLVKVTVMIDGVIDFLIYDCREERFTELQYYVGVGKGISFEGFEDSTGFYDEIELRTFKIPLDD
jgi:hypothetical protein